MTAKPQSVNAFWTWHVRFHERTLPPQINEKYKTENEIIEINQHNNMKANKKQQNLMTMRNVFAAAL